MQINKGHTNKMEVRTGFTLIELLVVVAIISILAAILFPVFARARENARRSGCMSNLKQMGTAMMMYAQDYDEHFPPLYNTPVNSSGTTITAAWNYLIQPYVKNAQIFNCPSTDTTYFTTTNPHVDGLRYGLNILFGEYSWWRDSLGRTGLHIASIENPAQTIFILDDNSFRAAPEGTLYDTTVRKPAYRHLETANTLFVDGHVKSLNRSRIQERDTSKAGNMQLVLWGFTTSGP